jgi:hypothetical protein
MGTWKNSQYNCHGATRMVSTGSSTGTVPVESEPITVVNYGDDSGSPDSTTFLAPKYFSTHFAVPLLAEWVVFVGTEPAEVSVYPPGAGLATSSFALQRRTDAHTTRADYEEWPTCAKVTSIPAGTRFVSSECVSVLFDAVSSPPIVECRLNFSSFLWLLRCASVGGV